MRDDFRCHAFRCLPLVLSRETVTAASHALASDGRDQSPCGFSCSVGVRCRSRIYSSFSVGALALPHRIGYPQTKSPKAVSRRVQHQSFAATNRCCGAPLPSIPGSTFLCMGNPGLRVSMSTLRDLSSSQDRHQLQSEALLSTLLCMEK